MLTLQIPLDCTVHEMVSLHKNLEIPWDNRETSVHWAAMATRDSESSVMDRNCVLKKMVEPTEEPDHEIVPGTLRSIQVLLSAIADYSQYLCDVDSIHFEDTLMFQVSFAFSFYLIWQMNLADEFDSNQTDP